MRIFLVVVLMILGGVVGCGPNFEKGSEFQITENGNLVSITSEEKIEEDFIAGRDGYGIEVDGGALRGRILLTWPANEVGTYAGEFVEVERVTNIESQEVEFRSDNIFNDDCNDVATITITSVEYGLVIGEFSGDLCERGSRGTRRLDVEGTFAGSVADGYWD